MISKNTPVIGDPSFEKLKQSNEHDAEYWSARDLQPLLGYSQWRRFEDAIKRAITSCEQSENNSAHHFADAGKLIVGGKEVRAAIERIGGTLPEKIAPAEHIKEVEKRIKNAVPKMELDKKDAVGLLGGNQNKTNHE
ncbi:MAG: hypothetical protein Q7U78_12430 [Gallionella sp.]|nr:hypothetical protein [Gallionella sp.]